MSDRRGALGELRAAAALVRVLALRNVASHRLRLLLSALGVASGVALAIAVSSLDSSMEATLRDVARSSATRASVEVRSTAGEGLDETIVDDVAHVGAVTESAAAVEAFTIFRAGDRSARALLLGLDPAASALAPAAAGAGRLASADLLDRLDALGRESAPIDLSRPGTSGVDELFRERAADPTGTPLIVSAALAGALDAGEGDDILVSTPRGWARAIVAEIATGSDARRTRTAAGSLPDVQALLGREGLADVVYAVADDHDAALAALEQAVGTRARVGPVAFRQQELRQVLASAMILLRLTGVLALFVGGFLVFNTMSMAAVEQTVEMSILRAVGARRRQVFALQCAQGGAIGAIGSLLGVGGGILLSRTVLSARGAGLRELMPVEVTRLVVRPVDVATATVVGVAASLAATYLPARRVARAEPSRSLGAAGALEEPGRRTSRLSVVAGVACLLTGSAAIGAVAASGRIDRASPGLALALAGLALLIRPGVPAAAGIVLRPILRDRGRATGVVRLAAGEVLRSPGRTAFTVGAGLLALSVVLSVTLGMGSFARTFRRSFDEFLVADLYARPATWRAFGTDVPADAAIADELAAVPGVSGAYPFRFATTVIRGQTTVILAYEQAAYAVGDHASARMRASPMRTALHDVRPNSVLISASTTGRLGYSVGDEIPLATPGGTVPITVTGVLADPTAINPTLYLAYDDFRRLWRSAKADSFQIALRPGADPEIVRAEIDRGVGARHGLSIDTRAEYGERANALIGSLLGVVSSLVLVVVVTAGLGLANTLIISTFERTRDLGVLRAIGMRRAQVRRMVMAEALIVGLLGVAASWAVGTMLAYLFTASVQAQVGVPMPLVLTPRGYVQTALLGVVGAVVAALYPAARAARADVVSALHYE